MGWGLGAERGGAGAAVEDVLISGRFLRFNLEDGATLQMFRPHGSPSPGDQLWGDETPPPPPLHRLSTITQHAVGGRVWAWPAGREFDVLMT